MDFHYHEDEVMATAEALLGTISATAEGATVVGLSGDLGAGKTTLVKAIAANLGVEETVVSPTFVIAKFYETKSKVWKQLIHIDAYRIEHTDELIPLGWDRMRELPQTLIIVEWPERIAAALPDNTVHFAISHTPEGRHIKKV